MGMEFPPNRRKADDSYCVTRAVGERRRSPPPRWGSYPAPPLSLPPTSRSSSSDEGSVIDDVMKATSSSIEEIDAFEIFDFSGLSDGLIYRV